MSDSLSLTLYADFTFARGAGRARLSTAPPGTGTVVKTLKHMIDLAAAGRLRGICFAPLNKGALHQGGFRFYDEHQMFASMLGYRGYFGEMNVLNGMWASRVTSHVGFKDVIGLITPERLDNAIRLTAGLPTVFTTPAHGTAYDIVGQGKATTGPLEYALSMAAKLAATKVRPAP